MNDHWFRVYSGLLTPAHLNKIGSALSLFLWCIDKTTMGSSKRAETIAQKMKISLCEGERLGMVLGGQPINAVDIGRALGMHPETVRKNMRRLKMGGYILLMRAAYGWIVIVRKSKKWGKKYTTRQSENALSVETVECCGKHTERQSENALSVDKRYSENALSVDKRYSENALSKKIPYNGDITNRTDERRNGHKESVDKRKLFEITKLIEGNEQYIKKDSGILVQKLSSMRNAKEPRLIWAYVIQARRKRTPAGYLAAILSNGVYAPAEWAIDQAKKEMEYYGGN